MISLSHVDICPVVSFPGWEDRIATSRDQVPSQLALPPAGLVSSSAW